MAAVTSMAAMTSMKIATIRTMLNYFLAKDIAEFDSVRNASGNPLAA